MKSLILIVLFLFSCKESYVSKSNPIKFFSEEELIKDINNSLYLTKCYRNWSIRNNVKITSTLIDEVIY
jgi:hypothetical protein